jgi:hypothetical protein
MRILAIAGLGLLSLSAGGAEKETAFRFVSLMEAQRDAGVLGQAESLAAMWVWTDKYYYQPGEQITVRWTLQPNNDLYPYTVFAYRQNNQTGAKIFLPAGSADAADIFGNTAQQGYRITRLPEPNKQVLGSAITAPEELGMHTIVVELRDYMGGRVIKAAYFKFGIVSGMDNLPSTITENRRLTNERAYRVQGIVAVRNNAVLTIDPGTFIIGMPGSQPPSVLLVTTQGRLEANGTRSRPIIMTSSQPFGQRQRGDWGGLIMLGTAPINDPGGSLTIEGLPELPETQYGGSNAGHNCGTLRYVRVEFAGALLRPNEETNSFTWGGCGTQTVAEHLQAHYGLDDSFEWFGGTNDAKYLVGTYGADDYIDVQVGYTGRIQHVLAMSNADLANRGVEADNYERNFAARPLGKAQMWNMTFLGGHNQGFDETDSPCLYYRRGAGGVTNNVICMNWTTRGLGGANFDSISPNIAGGDFAMNGILLWNNGREANRPNDVANQVGADYGPFARGEQGQGRNIIVADPMLRRPLVLNDPDPRPMTGSPAFRPSAVAPPDTFFDQSAAFLGAFGEELWTAEWTMFIQEQDLAQ